MKDLNSCTGLVERLFWLVKLRWIAVAGVLLTILLTSRVFRFVLPFFSLFLLAFFLIICNLVYIVLLKRYSSVCKRFDPHLPDVWSFGIINGIANIQISFDLLILMALIHFSGGIENPFLFYSIFHMTIASILLSRWESFLQATLAVSFFSIMVVSEYSGVLPHYSLTGFMAVGQYKNLGYVGGISFVFVTTLYIAVYMATSIARRLRQRERLLRQANVLLNEKDRAKSEYVVRVSHDIKEDLAAIQSCLEPVEGGITGELNSRQKDLISRAVHRTQKLLFFVKALLEITRIRLSQEIKMDYFSFKEIVSEAVGQISSKAKAKNISVTAFVEPTIDKIRGAKEYLQETITNLLANSVKYTPSEGRINIHVTDKGNSILMKIEDTGIGIPKDDMPKIFDEFYRASNAKEVERDGTGLGLSIAKQVIERHNGKIWVESKEGHGSAFYILLSK
ncbi:MAG: HAMP domain-containing sensor histidine kinase [Candidatus Omnitrophota bacterium]